MNFNRYSFKQKPKLEFRSSSNESENSEVSSCPNKKSLFQGKDRFKDKLSSSEEVRECEFIEFPSCSEKSDSQEIRCRGKHTSNCEIKKTISEKPNMDAEERLRHAISNYSEHSRTKAKRFDDSIEVGSKKYNSPKDTSAKQTMPDTCSLSNAAHSAASYSGYQPKKKRRRAVFLEDDDDEDVENIRPSKKIATGFSDTKSEVTCRDEENTNAKKPEIELSEVEKLKEIYTDLSKDEAEDALNSSGNLTDAILNLADKVTSEDKKQKKKATSSVIIEDDNSSDSEIESSEMTASQTVIWSFFQEASASDIACIPNCSEKKAEAIVRQRDFANYQDLSAKMDKIKGMSSYLLEDSLEFIRERREINKLMNKCKCISSRIEATIKQDSLPNKDNDLEVTSCVPLRNQPEILNKKFSLKQYQMAGLNWLITLHKEGVNGILADQMGLGKTIQALAFIGYLIENGFPGPHLIIVPSSTCDNWYREIETWLPTVKYIYYRGSQEERISLREELLYGDEEYNIILCTYSIATSTPKDRSLFRKLETHYLILDEGHMLKNMKSQRYKNLMEIKATRRLLLTGTPVQNNLLELMSLLSFIMPDLFAERLSGINMLFGSKQKSKASLQESTVKAAKNILKPFILRRLKQDVLKDLPEKVEKLIKCEITQKQRVFYDHLVQQYRSLVGQKLDYGGAVGFLMKLRKTANHPLLERNLYDKELLSKMARDYVKQLENRESTFDYVLEDMEVMSDFELHTLCNEKYYLSQYRLQTEAIVSSGKFKQLDVLLPQLKEKGSRVLMFSQFTSMLDIMEPYMKHLKYKFLRLDGQTPVAERLDLIDKYNNNRDIFVFLLSTKAGGLGINLTSADVVILHDIDFNPYNDKQAEDRCHRVGQQKDVTIYKLISKNTIEEGILKCANSKLNLERNIAGHHEDAEKKTSEDDVRFLMESI